MACTPAMWYCFHYGVSCQNKDLDTQFYIKQIRNCGSKISSAVIHLKKLP